jgi:hypothetical protein
MAIQVKFRNMNESGFWLQLDLGEAQSIRICCGDGMTGVNVVRCQTRSLAQVLLFPLKLMEPLHQHVQLPELPRGFETLALQRAQSSKHSLSYLGLNAV